MGFLLPARCAACGSPGWRLCPRCAGGLSPAAARAPPPGLTSCRSLLRYDGPARQLVVGMKAANRRAVVPLLGHALATAASAEGYAAVDVVTWPPTTAEHRRHRGYDQAELLARAVARRLGRPARALLTRPAGDRAQSGLGRRERRAGPTFVARSSWRPLTGVGSPEVVLLIDDVLTTGGTLSAAARVLLAAGSLEVNALTVAAVGDGGGRSGAATALGGRPMAALA
jgi:predicted amidophosphoribosyltransferase